MSLEIPKEDLDESAARSSDKIKVVKSSSEFFQIDEIVPEANAESIPSVNNLIDTSLLSIPTSEELKSENNYTKEFKKLSADNEFYEGEVLLNNLHGHGFFLTQKNGQKVFYDGLFYVNKLEGYSQIFYEKGTYFQGLYKQHRRYGPGVLTYSNGSQDVGFWDGFTLVRLASVVGSETVPRLATTVSGKTKLLCYRYLVPLCNENDDLSKNIFRDIGVNAEVLKRSNVILNVTIRNPNSLFFHQNFFDNHFFGGKDCTIKVAVEEYESYTSLEGKEKSISEEEFCDRIRKLKSKIKEIDESLQPYLAIKGSIQEKIRYCVQCCTVKDSIELSKTNEPSSATLLEKESPLTFGCRSDDAITLDLKSLMPDASFYDPSIVSYNTVQELDIEKTLHEASTTSSKQNIIDFCICGEQEIDDLQHLEDQLANIIKQETFYTNIRDNLQTKVNNMIEKEEKKREYPKPRFKLITVTELWAWNNEEYLMQIQKHCFQHRNSEEMVNFNVPNLILGNRKDFGEIGEYEDTCHKFLTACSKGKKEFVRRCLRENINPNLSDARGNSSIFFATAKDQIEIISILTNFGAKLDQINDEQLTPLSLCILKYLSQKNQSDNWEKAFLPETQICTIPNLPKWYHMQSLISQSSSTFSKQSDSIDKQSSQNEFSNSRIVELFRRLSNLNQKTTSFIRNVPNTSYLLDLSYKDFDSPDKCIDDQNNANLQNKLKATHLTIMTLLDYGADPNLAKVPYPPLVLCLFSENPDLVMQLLQANADANVLVTEDNISCLHVICSLRCSGNTIEICRLLLLFKCNPNLKTSSTHWEDRNLYFIGNIPQEFDCEDSGKNALHLLCMRKDFENDNDDNFGTMCKLLVKGGINCSETYLGHTPLSLAVLAGNIRLVKNLIKSNIFDPYEKLAYNMGNILTLFTLKRFENTLPTDKCKAMLTALCEVDVNVLYKVGESENAIVFAEEGDAFFNLKAFDREEKKDGKGKVKPTSTPKKGEKYSQCTVIKEFLKDLGRDTIIKQIQLLASEILYDFTEENILEETYIAVVLAEFLNPHIIADNLEVLFHLGKIDSHRLNQDYVKTLLNFVDLHKKITKAKKVVQKAPKGKKGGDIANGVPTEETIDHLILKVNFKKSAVVLPRLKYYVVKPGFDNPEVYKVCFHCLKSENKELKLCPRCQMIRFCSTQCNKLNLKVKTLHTCNFIFYDMEKEDIQDVTKDESLLQLANTAMENCRNRLYKKRKSRLLQEELKLLEMWRADTYGTKFLKLKPLLHQASKHRKSTEFSVNLDELTKLLERNFQKNPADFDSYNIEALMHKLSRERIRETRKSERSSLGHCLGSKLGSRVGSILSQFLTSGPPKEDKTICTCSETITHAKPKQKDNSDRPKKDDLCQTKPLETLKSQNINELLPTQFEDYHGALSVRKTQKSPIRKKLKKIPIKYQKFIEVMGTYFPEVDMSVWLLPYACCSNGQLFYKFCDNEIFRESYSLT